MRVATIHHGDHLAAARVDGDELVILPFGDIGELLSTGDDWVARAGEPDGHRIAIAEAEFAPIVPRPEKIFGIGLNYADHAAEADRTATARGDRHVKIPDHPMVFGMFWRALLGANADLVLPANSEMVDWEAELGLVIGREIHHADPEEAAGAIAGYTIINDVSMRDWQRRTPQLLQGKTFEASTPAGPFLVTGDEVDHARDLRMTCYVDDSLMQDGSTSDMVFKSAEIVSYLSQIITLVPGDLVATGTPSGVGGARRPPVYLHEGQVLRTAIDGLGEQVNRCVAVNSKAPA